MGQYYKPVLLEDDGLTPQNYLLAHDYDNGLKLMEHSYLKNNFVNAVETLLINKATKLVWAGDYAEEVIPQTRNTYELAGSSPRLTPEEPTYIMPIEYPYLINETKKQYVDKLVCPNNIHPLPLLTSEGNGQGGGDFRGVNTNVGTWARNYIRVSKEVPEGYTEIRPDFEE